MFPLMHPDDFTLAVLMFRLPWGPCLCGRAEGEHGQAESDAGECVLRRQPPPGTARSLALAGVSDEEAFDRAASCPQVPYRLHAVLVHEGQASAGHYWAYIYDHQNQRWMKYNDINISESSWEELERDSFGGMTNASAYCLMYIHDRLPDLITGWSPQAWPWKHVCGSASTSCLSLGSPALRR